MIGRLLCWRVLAGLYTPLLCLCLLTSGLGCAVGCFATVATMFPVYVDTQRYLPALTNPQLVTALLLSASCSLASPLGYPTSVIVQRAERLKWIDFVKFGGILQVLLCFIIPGVVLGVA